MASLITFVAVAAALLAAGALGVRTLRPWTVPLRGGLAAMFTLTGVAHFVHMREQLIAMVPPALPAPELLVTTTGVLELAGAAGLLLPRTAPWAAAGLSALLVAMFPANVHAALEGIGTPLLPRTLMQVLYLAATLAVVAHHLRTRRPRALRSRAAPGGPRAGAGAAARDARRSAAEGTRSLDDQRSRPARAL